MGEGTTACASDSKRFGAWDQNLLTEWHARYGGPGVMIYYHVERNSVCIYSQLKSCSSSEAAAMIEGVLRHDTEMDINKNYVDTHGQSEVGFALHLLQVSLVYVNTLMIQQVLDQHAWQGRLTARDLRALTPLKWQHINPYGTFLLDMRQHLRLELAA